MKKLLLLFFATVMPLQFSLADVSRQAVIDGFSRTPILFNGRKMPLDSFARQLLVQFSGRQSVEGISASEWLAELVMNPGSISSLPVFMVNHPEVLQAIDMDVEEGRRYSFEELGHHIGELADLAIKASNVPEEQRSLVDRELIRLYENMQVYLSLFQSLQYDAPVAAFSPSPPTAEALSLPGSTNGYSYLEIFRRVPVIQELMEPLKGRDAETWSLVEQEVFLLSSGLFEWTQNSRDNLFTIIPFKGHGADSWMSPWEAILFMGEHRYLETELGLLSAMRRAWVEQDFAAVQTALDGFRESSGWRTQGDREVSMADLEVHYNRASWFTWSKLFYGLGFLFAFAGMFTRKRFVGAAAWMFLLAGFLPHTVGLVERMVIMARPPVTNLYATFLFVSWIVTVLCLAMELFQKNRLGLVVAGFAGLALLMISARFAFEGDSMGKMVAVLNSNFWLSTHVVCISTGYAGCVAAGLVGHLYLLARIIRPADRERQQSLMRALYGVLGFGLTFSFFGTMLGGIWADQSWGRFWGWDPKENGALLIVIWCAVLFHARMGGMIRDVGLAAGTGLGIIVVMFAWLGVNLLGVGLHSYGFTSGLARGLYTYTAIQLLVVALLVWLARRKHA